jgi:hypothetical protein
VPDGTSRLSDGVIVETRLTALLLGVRLLRVNGIILMSPARLVGPAPAVAPGAPSRNGAPVSSRVHAADASPRPKGAALAQAARLLQENEDRLRRLSSRGGSRTAC